MHLKKMWNTGNNKLTENDRFDKEILTVKTDLETIKTLGTNVTLRIGSDKVKLPSTYDEQTLFEIFRLQFDVVSKTNNWSDK